MQLLIISKDSTGYLAKLPQSPLQYRLPKEKLEAFKRDCDHWDEWSLGMGQTFSTAMSDDACNLWAIALDPVIPMDDCI